MTILKNLDLITDHSPVEINMLDEIMNNCPPIWRLNDTNALETFNLEAWSNVVKESSGNVFLNNDMIHIQFGSIFEYTLNVFSHFYMKHDFVVGLKFAGFHRQLQKQVVFIFPLYMNKVGNYRHFNLDSILSDFGDLFLVNAIAYSINNCDTPLLFESVNIEFSNHHITKNN